MLSLTKPIKSKKNDRNYVLKYHLHPETSDPGKKKEQDQLRPELNDYDFQSKDVFHPANAKYPEWLIKNELPLYNFFLELLLIYYFLSRIMLTFVLTGRCQVA